MPNLESPSASVNRQNDPASAAEDLQELLARARAAIDQARRQISTTRLILEESKQNLNSESSIGHGALRR